MSSSRLEHKHLELYVFSAHKINTCDEIKVLRVQELVSGTEDCGNTAMQAWQVRLEGQCRAPVPGPGQVYLYRGALNQVFLQ